MKNAGRGSENKNRTATTLEQQRPFRTNIEIIVESVHWNRIEDTTFPRHFCTIL